MAKIRGVRPVWFNARAYASEVLHEDDEGHDVLVFPMENSDGVRGYGRLRNYGDQWRLTVDIDGRPSYSHVISTQHLMAAFDLASQTDRRERSRARALRVDAYLPGLFVRDRRFLAFAGPVKGGKWQKGMSVFIDEDMRDSVLTFITHAV